MNELRCNSLIVCAQIMLVFWLGTSNGKERRNDNKELIIEQKIVVCTMQS